MSEEQRRSVEVVRTATGSYEAVNARGGRVEVGTGEDARFTPVELLLASIAACSAIDVDFITVKRADPEHFTAAMSAEKVRDEHGNRLVNLLLSFDVRFPDGEGGDAARAVLPGAVRRSHDRLCTVSRTVEIGTPVDVRLA